MEHQTFRVNEAIIKLFTISEILYNKYLRSGSVILKEVKDGLRRNWEPYGCSCTKNHAIGLARIHAFMHCDTNTNLIHPRKGGPTVAMRCANTSTEIVHHPLC